MAIEISATIIRGSGSNWDVDILNRGPTGGWDMIGDLSSVTGSDWTSASLTMTSSSLTDYLDKNFDNEMLIRVRTQDTFQVREVLFSSLGAHDSQKTVS